MEFLGIRIVEHASLSPDEVWIIHEKEVLQVPLELRDSFTVPYILTGDATQARQLLSLIRAIDGHYGK